MQQSSNGFVPLFLQAIEDIDRNAKEKMKAEEQVVC